MGQQSSSNNQTTSRNYSMSTANEIYNKRIQHQGILKLRAVPFKNCVQITTEHKSLFIENIDITLKDLLESRLYTNKLFPKQDIERLIQNITYTLAFLQQNGIPYKNVTPQNVYYDEQIFKLLPNQLIPAFTYTKFLMKQQKKTTSNFEQALQNDFVQLSPQMIIAFRCKQTQITDMEILDKSNVFYLGLLLLEVVTLLPSFECYDRQTLDILDEVISERIQMAKDYYSQEIASIIANMLDYDYVQRMSLKEMSIFVNRQLNKEKLNKQQNPRTPKKLENLNSVHEIQAPRNQFQPSNSIVKSRISNMEENIQLQASKHSYSRQKKRGKTNKIYMNGSNPAPPEQQEVVVVTKDERNKIYMKNCGQLTKKSTQSTQNIQGQTYSMNRSPSALKQISINQQGNRTPSRLRENQVFSKNRSKYQNQNEGDSFGADDLNKYSRFNGNNEQDYQNNDQYYKKSSVKNKNNNDYVRSRPQNMKASVGQSRAFNDRKNVEKDEPYMNKPFNYAAQNDYNNYQERSQYSQQQRSKTYEGQFQNQRINYSKVNNNQGKDHDNSLHRIKSEIQRSRKLIEQFKRGETSNY